jgi:flagellar biosynthesis chaperone FliJ
MKRNLARLQTVRSLMEELARLDFEKKTAEARQIETEAVRQGERTLAARTVALQVLERASPSWQLAVADAEILAWRRRQLARLADQCRPAVRAAREAFLTRRQERRQLEILMATAVRKAERELARREQRLADDWYQARTARNRSTE